MNFYGFGEVLDPSIFTKIRIRKNQYIYCTVYFEDMDKWQYYITEDDSIGIDDLVIVPTGKSNREKITTVVDVGYFFENEAPTPVNETKYIIDRCSEEDLDYDINDNGYVY